MSRHARRTDPETSHAAAARAEFCGLIKTDTEIFSGLVGQYPGITIPEMAHELTSTHPDCIGTSFMLALAREHFRQRMARRAGDVRREGLAHSRGERDGACCWWPGKEPIKVVDPFQPTLWEDSE